MSSERGPNGPAEPFDIEQIGQAEFDRKIGRGVVRISYIDPSIDPDRIIREYPDGTRVFVDYVNNEPVETPITDKVPGGPL